MAPPAGDTVAEAEAVAEAEEEGGGMSRSEEKEQTAAMKGVERGYTETEGIDSRPREKAEETGAAGGAADETRAPSATVC